MKSLKSATILLILSLTIGLLTSCTSNKSKEQSQKYDRVQVITNADSSLHLLISGNHRFVSDSVLEDNLSKTKRAELKEKGQKPFATIITCSDSRVAPELLFDQGLGDLFVIRVAGNVLDSVGLGSLEYAIEHLHTSLVVVLGHENCGAVTASVKGGEIPGNIPSICNRIAPSIAKVKSTGATGDIIDKVIDQNILENVSIILKDKIIEEFIKESKVKVIGAKYHLETGEVTYF